MNPSKSTFLYSAEYFEIVTGGVPCSNQLIIFIILKEIMLDKQHKHKRNLMFFSDVFIDEEIFIKSF